MNFSGLPCGRALLCALQEASRHPLALSLAPLARRDDLVFFCPLFLRDCKGNAFLKTSKLFWAIFFAVMLLLEGSLLSFFSALRWFLDCLSSKAAAKVSAFLKLCKFFADFFSGAGRSGSYIFLSAAVSPALKLALAPTMEEKIAWLGEG